jgi:hypothetical protein
MLYGSVACGTCYLVAAICLKEGTLHPDISQQARLFRFTIFGYLSLAREIQDWCSDNVHVLPLLFLLRNQLRQGKFYTSNPLCTSNL